MSLEVVQALAAFLTAITGQAQAGQAPPAVSPSAPPVPPPPPLLVPPQAPDVSISKKLKEARQLSCISFKGDLDATAAKDWIIQVSETLNDMRLDDDMKLMVATRLLEKRARTWWNSMKSRSTVPSTWSDFLREFDGQYYTYFHQKEKKREFLSLKQGSLTIEEYEARFNELMSYVPDLVKIELDQANYFEEGLRNEIRDCMIVIGQAIAATLSPEARTDIQIKDSSESQPRQGVAMRSGMDWLTTHRANVDCFRKEVVLQNSEGVEVVFAGECRVLPSCVISTIKALKLVQKGYPTYLAYVIDTSKGEPKLEDVPIVNEFSYMFLSELPSLPPDQELKFSIDLLPSTAPISIPSYRMAPTELKELKV
ncbi:Retrotransposon gag domain - like 10 [Theobroma cacao]|nr:Retrotransposon gag domain - like 10 [Theobroma cacao]